MRRISGVASNSLHHKLNWRGFRVGVPKPAYRLEDGMDKPDLCGMDVSAKELVVLVRRDGKTEADTHVC